MAPAIIALLSLTIAAAGNSPLYREQENTEDTASENLRKIQEAARENPPAQFRRVVMERRSARQKLHQQSYAALLYDTVKHDCLGALISYVRMRVLAELSLEHGFLFWIIPPDPVVNTPGLPFEEDLSLPADPWKRE